MNATTAQFIDADSVSKETLLIDGINFVNEELKGCVENIRRLNAWLKCFNAVVRSGEMKPARAKELIDAIAQFNDRMDDVTDHIMVTSVITYTSINKVLVL